MSVQARFFPFLPTTDFSFMKDISRKDCVWIGASVLVGLGTASTLVTVFAWSATSSIASGILPSIAMIAYSILIPSYQNKDTKEITTDKGDVVDVNFQKGINYYKGNGIEKNFDKALEYLRGCAKKGNADAQFYVGKIYEYRKDYTKALIYYLKAKELNHAQATHHIGWMYEHGVAFKKSPSLASKFYSEAKQLSCNHTKPLVPGSPVNRYRKLKQI